MIYSLNTLTFSSMSESFTLLTFLLIISQISDCQTADVSSHKSSQSTIYNSTLCSQPCRNGTFQALPCIENKPKLCQECTRSCPEDHFMSKDCDPQHDIVCKPCRSKCGRVDYEYTPCTGQQDRQCRDIDRIPRPRFSENLIYENRREVKQVVSFSTQQDSSSTTSQWNNPIRLNRGTGFSVEVVIREANLAPLYTAVDHSRYNDNAAFHGDSRITQDYCSFPVPEKYQLSLVLHQGITTKARLYVCDEEKRARGRCEMETGQYLNPSEPCQTYTTFGRLPSLDLSGQNIICTQMSRLADAFGVSSQLSQVSAMLVDKSVKCAEQRSGCDSCTVSCARSMQNYRGSHRCNVTADDADNGESPRLSYCFSCCSRQDCSKLCEVYHSPNCQQIRCLTGNLAEFILSPIFSSRESIFACHVRPVPGYTIYDIEYNIIHQGRTINSRTQRVKREFNGFHPHKATDAHNFLKIHFGSEVTSMPDLVEGDSSLRTFSAGSYQAKGQGLSMEENGITSRTLTVRPKQPLSVNSGYWKTLDCDTRILSEFILASSTGYPDSDPYLRDPQLEVQFMGKDTYRIFNKSHSNLPYIYFEVPPDRSIFKPMFEHTTVRDDGTLKADLIRNEGGWSLLVLGQLLKCPGSFEITVMDPSYPSQPLFEYDVVVNCPGSFSVEFEIPTEGRDDYSKTFLVHVTDSYRTIRLTVYRPAPFNMDDSADQTIVHYDVSNEVRVTLFSPVVVFLSVFIIVLTVLLFAGFLTEKENAELEPMDRTTRHRLLLVICYSTFRATYSIVLTFTLLILIINHINRDKLTVLSRFHKYCEMLETGQQQEMEKIHAAALAEISRQNSLANQTKKACEAKLDQLQNVLEESKKQIRVQSSKDRLVSQVALQYTRLLLLNLTDNINKFKKEFSTYAKRSVDQLMKTMAQTSNAIQSNKWLAGAKIIYDVVKSKRTAQGLETKTFLDWVGMEQQMGKLMGDLTLNDFPMPNLTDYLSMDLPKTDEEPSIFPPITEVVLPRNQWYYQFERKSVNTDNSFSNSADMIKSDKDVKSDNGGFISWASFIAILASIDFIWFVHRMARTYSTAKLVLYGSENSDKVFAEPLSEERNKDALSSRCFSCFRDFNFRVMKTDFVPKLVITVTTCCFIYVIVTIADRLLTVRALASVGYFEAQVAPLETSYKLARTRIRTNAYRINRFEFPFYEHLVNVRTKRYQLLLEMYAELQRTGNLLRDSEYCAWKRLVSPGEACRCTSAQVPDLKFDGCELTPVMHQPIKGLDFGAYREQLSRDIVPYINALRSITSNTCHLVLIFIIVIVLADILGAVLWIYLRRFGLLRTRSTSIEVTPPQQNIELSHDDQL